MATGFNKQFNGQNLVPQNTTAPSSNGDMRYNSSTNKVELYNGAVDPLVTEADTATLTNKTIAAGNNTISGLANANLSGTAAITNANLNAMPANTIKGNNTGSSATPVDLTVSQVNTLLGTIQTIGTIDSEGTPSANALTISGTSIIAQSASGSATGMVNQGTQSFAGAKTFNTSVSTPVVHVTGAGIDSSLYQVNGTGGNATIQSAAGTTTSYSISLPAAQATSGNQTILNDGSGNLTWSTPTPSTSTATAAATTTLNSSSTYNQYFTGSTTQTVKLPVATTMIAGQSFSITNQSSGIVTVQTSGLNTIQAMGANTNLLITCANTAGGTGTASWTWVYTAIDTGLALANPMTTGGDTIYGASGGTATRLANGTSGQVMQSSGGTSAPVWATIPGNTTIVKAPTYQVFTSGAATYTRPSSPAPILLKVRMVGGGGGGGANGNGTIVTGTSGGQTSFAGATAPGGAFCTNNNVNVGLGGAAGTLNGFSGFSLAGATGMYPTANQFSPYAPTGGAGGASVFGGGATGGYATGNGTSPQANTGAGGAGAGAYSSSYENSGGGGAGAYTEVYITSPASTYSYTVGSGGNGGTTSGGASGGSGAAGIIIVEEIYQ